MTTPENTFSPQPQDLEENATPNNEFEGIADEKFRSFIESAVVNFPYDSEGRVFEGESIRRFAPEIYKAHNLPISFVGYQRLASMRSRMSRLEGVGLYKKIRIANKSVFTDRDSMINGLSYLFAERKLNHGQGKRIKTKTILAAVADLWGENPRAQLVKKVVEEKFSSDDESDASGQIDQNAKLNVTKYLWGDEKDIPLSEKLETIRQDEIKTMLKKANYEEGVDNDFKRSNVKYSAYKIDQQVGDIIEYIRLASLKRLDLFQQDIPRRNTYFLEGLRWVGRYLQAESDNPKIKNLKDLYERVLLIVNRNPSSYGLQSKRI